MPRMKEFIFDPRCSKFDPRCNKFDPWLKLFSRKIIKTKRKNYNANQVRRFFSFWSVNVSRPNREIFIQRAWPFTWPFVTFLWEEKLMNVGPSGTLGVGERLGTVNIQRRWTVRIVQTIKNKRSFAESHFRFMVRSRYVQASKTNKLLEFIRKTFGFIQRYREK